MFLVTSTCCARPREMRRISASVRTAAGRWLKTQSGANQTYNSLYGTLTFRQLPRSAQLTLRTTF